MDKIARKRQEVKENLKQGSNGPCFFIYSHRNGKGSLDAVKRYLGAPLTEVYRYPTKQENTNPEPLMGHRRRSSLARTSWENQT